MKQIVTGIVCIGIVISIGVFALHHQPSVPKNTPPSSTPSVTATAPLLAQASPPKTITYNDQTYSYDIIGIHAADISLVANFTQKIPVQSIMDTHQCAQAVNGGFYDTQDRPLGFFLTYSYTHNRIQSTLLNGYFIISDKNEASITPSSPSGTLRIGVQSGPLLFINSRMQPLRIQNDEHARRVAVGITDDKTILFIVLYDSQSVFNGPFLSHVPALLGAIGQRESIRLTDALNLDGGSASAFYSDSIRLSELTPVGSIFCIR